MWITLEYTAAMSSHLPLSLSVSARVFEGNWNMLRVALKVLRTQDGVIPNPAVSQQSVIVIT